MMSTPTVDAASPSPSIDCHVHLAPYLPGWPRQDGKLVVDRHAVGPPALGHPEQLLEHLATLGLDQALVSPPPPFFRPGLDAAAAAEWARTLNDGILAATGDDARLLPLAYLPLDHPVAARAEFERCAGEPRWAGACGSAGGAAVSLADPQLGPLWDELDARSSLVLLHPGSSPDARLAEFYLHNLLGNPVETAVAAAQLVFGDVVATHQRLRVLLVHCGGCVPDLVPRWDHGVATRRPGLRPLTEAPSVAVRRFYVDCLVHDAGAVDRAIAVFGADRVVLGSDWPFPMGAEDPRALVAHRGPAYVEQVSTVNAARALGRAAP
jgi:aminocarboxymuconate-semialdehyde decarboxylase